MSFMDDYISQQQIIADAIRKDKARERTPLEKQEAKAYKKAFENFASSGWIPYLQDFEFSNRSIVRLSELNAKEVDNYIWCEFTAHHNKKCKKMINRLAQVTFENPHYFACARILYDKKEYLGCSMMICALIEQKLRNNGATPYTFGIFMSNVFGDQELRFGIYNDHPIKYLLTPAVSKIMEEIYKDADDFSNEGDVISRPFLMHGMAKRGYTQKECIQLFCILDFICKFEGGRKS